LQKYRHAPAAPFGICSGGAQPAGTVYASGKIRDSNKPIPTEGQKETALSYETT
jgi:hypothetical protein